MEGETQYVTTGQVCSFKKICRWRGGGEISLYYWSVFGLGVRAKTFTFCSEPFLIWVEGYYLRKMNNIEYGKKYFFWNLNQNMALVFFVARPEHLGPPPNWDICDQIEECRWRGGGGRGRRGGGGRGGRQGRWRASSSICFSIATSPPFPTPTVRSANLILPSRPSSRNCRLLIIGRSQTIWKRRNQLRFQFLKPGLFLASF